ncbi:minor capsid protein [Microbacterium sp. NPDC058389]|uniref:minor capsid protein n=1 Tax=Microbacterium sp. NPDC058389 TaxID=3346475 RepID=UPI00365C6945
MDDDELTFRLGEILGRIPGWMWDPNADAIPEGSVPIFYGRILDEPDRAVGVRVYGTEDRLTESLSERRAQIRFRGARGDARGANKLAAPAFTLLQGLSRVGGISDIRRLSMAPLGADNNGREERTDNYIITLDNTEAST